MSILTLKKTTLKLSIDLVLWLMLLFKFSVIKWIKLRNGAYFLVLVHLMAEKQLMEPSNFAYLRAKNISSWKVTALALEKQLSMMMLSYHSYFLLLKGKQEKM